MISWLLGPPAQTVEQQVQTWKAILRKERVSLESNNRLFDRLEEETKQTIREYVRIGETKCARILSGAIVNLQKARERNLIITIQIKSVETQLTQQLALAKVTRALAFSAKAMESMNALIKIPQLNETAKQLAQEMHKAGVIQEMLEDFEPHEATLEVVDAEVDSILAEIARELTLPSAPNQIDLNTKVTILEKKPLFE